MVIKECFSTWQPQDPARQALGKSLKSTSISQTDVKGQVYRYKDNTPWPDGSYNSYWDLKNCFLRGEL